jgi:hypothetical protein
MNQYESDMLQEAQEWCYCECYYEQFCSACKSHKVMIFFTNASTTFWICAECWWKTTPKQLAEMSSQVLH